MVYYKTFSPHKYYHLHVTHKETSGSERLATSSTLKDFLIIYNISLKNSQTSVNKQVTTSEPKSQEQKSHANQDAQSSLP